MSVVEPRSERFFGKYRGIVVSNLDPMRLGRLLVQVPDVFGLGTSSWAMPCLPVAGMRSGVYVVPPLQSSVWVEFEHGSLDHPIWVGGFWGTASEVPPAVATSTPPPGGQNVVVQTPGQSALVISDLAGPTGGLMLRHASGALVSVSDVGITITNGQGATISISNSGITIANGQGASIQMSGPTVDVNAGALTVT